MAENSDPPHRASVRLKGFDYTQSASYFVTIVTHLRKNLFGSINSAAMELSPLGNLSNDCWLEIPRHFPCVELPKYSVMPNHIHGIIVIHNGSRHGIPLPPADPRAEWFGRPMPGSLATIVRSFKSAVSKRAREIFQGPSLIVWQRGYFEHVIRNENDFQKTVKYILENPRRWEFDSENRSVGTREEMDF